MVPPSCAKAFARPRRRSGLTRRRVWQGSRRWASREIRDKGSVPRGQGSWPCRSSNAPDCCSTATPDHRPRSQNAHCRAESLNIGFSVL
jgi:hypothetical protein